MSSKQSPALNMTSGAGTLFHWAALRMTSSASSTRPFCKSQRGDSGIKLHTQEEWKAYSKTCTSKQDFSRFSVKMRYLSQLSPKCHPGWLTTVLSCLNWLWVNFAFEKLVSCARKKDSEAWTLFYVCAILVSKRKQKTYCITQQNPQWIWQHNSFQ